MALGKGLVEGWTALALVGGSATASDVHHRRSVAPNPRIPAR